VPSILFIRSSKQWGGIERQLLDHALRLRTRGWTPAFACLFRGAGEHPLAAAAQKRGISADTLPDPSPWSLKPLLALRTAIFAREPTWLHTCDYRSDILTHLAQSKRPQLAESHGYTEEGRAMKLWNVLDRRVLRQLPVVAPVSTAWETTLAAWGVSSQRLYTVGNSTAVLRQDDSPSPARLPSSGPHLLYAGRLSPEKGIDILLELWPRIRQHFPDARLWVLGASGDAAYQRRLRPLLHQPGIHALGHQPDTRPWLQAADAVIVPSRREAWGMTAFEALCAGTPLLATRVGGLPALCRGAPHAYLCHPADPTTFLARLPMAIAPESPRGTSLGQAYRAQPRFDPEQRHQRLLALYQERL
jgi:glycosyltransferase involved in cell wall biosynthesis